MSDPSVRAAFSLWASGHAARLRLGATRSVELPRDATSDSEGMRDMLAPVRLASAMGIAAAADRRAVDAVLAARTLGGRMSAAWLATSAPLPAGLRSLESSLSRGPIVLAAPLHLSILAVLGRVAWQRRWPIRVQRTPVTTSFLSPALESEFGLFHIADRELIAVARASASAPSPGGLWLTFPEHAYAKTGGRWLGSLCGQPHYYDTVIPLLAARLGAAVWTLDVGDQPGAVTLRPCAWVPGRRTAIEPAEIDRLYGELAEAMTRVLRAEPDRILSWSRIATNRQATVRGRQLRAVATLREMMYAWSAAVTSVHVSREQLQMLTRLESMIRESDGSIAREA